MDLSAQAASDAAWLRSRMKRTMCVDGIERPVFEAGAGPPVVCVPVLGNLNFLYAPQIRLLSGWRRVITYDPVLSTAAPVPLSARGGELRAVIRTLGLDRADLLGWSDGAIVASSFAACFPSMTSAVALLSLPGRFRGSLRAGARLVASLPLERLPMGGGIVSAALAGLCRGPMIRAHQLRSQMRAIPDFIHVFKYSLIPLLLDHAVAPNTISAATLVVVGDRDRLVSVKEARELAARLPRACGPVVIPSGEHFLTYANAAAVNGHLRSFFAPDD